MPKILERDETGLFIIKTSSNNICYGEIGYLNKKNEWIREQLSELVADETGICEWEWRASGDVSTGFAEFRVVVEQNGESIYEIPQSFCISNCP